MKQSLAIAYAIKRRNQHKMAKGGLTMPMEESDAEGEVLCAHGGPAMCAHGCYAEGGMTMHNPKLEQSHRYAEGGDVLDEDEEMEHFDEANSEDEDLDNGEGEKEPEEKRSMILSKILGKVRKFHRGGKA